MAKQTINIGASPNDGTGTPLRTAFDYCNLNFTELYTATGPSGNNIVCPGSATITGDLTVDTSTLKVDSSNDRVGIGTATPAAKLIVRDGSNRNLLVSSDAFQLGSAGVAIGSFTDNAAGYAPLSIIAGTSIGFGINGSTAMTLNSTGLGVGVSPAHKLQAVGGYVASGKLASASSGDIGGLLMYCSTDNGGRRSWGLKAESGTTGVLGFWLSSANNTEPFSGTQVMSLDASANLLVGTTTNTNGSRVFVRGIGTSPALALQSATGDVAMPGLVIGKFDNNSTTSQIIAQFTINNGAAGSGQINANGASQAAFGSYSDSRLKENILSLPSQLANILSLRPVEFDYKDGSGHQIGFVAQEMQEVYSDAVGEQNGFLTVTGWSKTEARLVSAIKELAAKVQALEAKLA